MMRVMARKLRDVWIYFRAGHSGYLTFTLSLLNFVVLQHRLLIEYVPFLSSFIPSLSTFFLLFVFTYIPLAIGIGYFEFKKGELTRRPILNPYLRDRNEALILQGESLRSFFDGDIDEAKVKAEESIQVMRKWRKSD